MFSVTGLPGAAAERLGQDNEVDIDADWLSCLINVIEHRQLSAVFQPILDTRSGDIIGYEGLIRGPVDGPLHSPMNLFQVANANNLTFEVERLCLRVILERFAELTLPGKLFLNVGPEILVTLESRHENILAYLGEIGLSASQIVFELTEGDCPVNYDVLCKSMASYRKMGFAIALDDLGEGFSSLRRWAELRPNFIKIDKYFIQGVHKDPLKQQFVRAIDEIAQKSRAIVIAEGIETERELQCIRDIGIACGQGYFIARPMANPPQALNPGPGAAPSLKKMTLHQHTATALSLLRAVAVATPQMSNSQVYDIFSAQPALQTIPVVDDGKPLGIITRVSLIDRFSRPYQRELYGKKTCTLCMDSNPLIADKDTSLQKLSHALVEADEYHLISDFIITDRGQYLGIGTSHDLLRELTQLQISAAKYAQPLTLLPGSVLINQHIDYLIQSNVPFSACYADLDNFKPFNDVFGYRRGDDVIQMTGRVLCDQAEPERDFVGHIGGDDFLILFQSDDWASRCQGILDVFAAEISTSLDIGGEGYRGYFAEDRKGERRFYPLPSLSLGVVNVAPMQYHSHHQIAQAAAEAKVQAKKTLGNSLFVDRRRGTSTRAG